MRHCIKGGEIYFPCSDLATLTSPTVLFALHQASKDGTLVVKIHRGVACVGEAQR
jgi:hypothetical protein